MVNGYNSELFPLAVRSSLHGTELIWLTVPKSVDCAEQLRFGIGSVSGTEFD